MFIEPQKSSRESGRRNAGFSTLEWYAPVKMETKPGE
jgi:hypothetical protein